MAIKMVILCSSQLLFFHPTTPPAVYPYITLKKTLHRGCGLPAKTEQNTMHVLWGGVCEFGKSTQSAVLFLGARVVFFCFFWVVGVLVSFGPPVFGGGGGGGGGGRQPTVMTGSYRNQYPSGKTAETTIRRVLPSVFTKKLCACFFNKPCFGLSVRQDSFLKS
jgi:hypothetical protein